MTGYIVTGVWSFIVLMVILGNVTNSGGKKPYESPTPVSISNHRWSIFTVSDETLSDVI
jgi:hypothetical protein